MNDGISLSLLGALEWDATAYLSKLFADAEESLTRRRLRLFRASCCRVLLYAMGDSYSRIVQSLELFAQGRMSREDYHRITLGLTQIKTYSLACQRWLDTTKLTCACQSYWSIDDEIRTTHLVVAQQLSA